MSAIVLDGHLKSALCVVRSLGTASVTIVCGAERKSAMACHSKYVKKRFVYTSPKTNQEQFIVDVVTEARILFETTGEKPVVFCFSDATMLTLARAYEILKEYIIIPFPSIESIETASDKARTYELAHKLSIPTIVTFLDTEFDTVAYPAVVKNRHSIVWHEGKSTSGSATFVFSKEELIAEYINVQTKTKEAPLVQEFVQGDEYGVEMVCDQGEPLATFVHRRIRSLSPKGGAAVVKETAQETEEVKMMRTYAVALVTELVWHGPVMVEFKVDAHSGRVLLMEINGRFWGSLPLPVRAGVNFPMMVYQIGVGGMVAKISRTSLPTHVRTRHFLGDCKWLLAVLFKNDRLRQRLYPSRFKALWDFKKEIFLSSGDIFRWNDLKPSIIEYADILRKK